MSMLKVVFRMLDKAGLAFVEPRREDGHGSHAGNLSHMQPHNAPETALYTHTTNWPEQTGLTDTQLRATPVPVALDSASLVALENVTVNVEAGASVGVNNFPAVYPLPPEQVQVDALTDAQLRAAPIAVRDDYTSGELLDDQVGSNNVLTFTFSSPVSSFWVAPQGVSGTCKIDHYGGTPSATRGIPADVGGALPIPEPATVVRVFTPAGVRVTVWGQKRA